MAVVVVIEILSRVLTTVAVVVGRGAGGPPGRAVGTSVECDRYPVAIGVKLDSRGPVFFKQTRYGVRGERIKVWKFRSMKVCEDGPDVPQAKRGDPRITPFGAMLRRTSLDELPQLFNVLSGSMSLIGPRPHAVAHNEFYRSHIQGYMLRHKVKPGITGLAQVNGFRGETETMDKMGWGASDTLARSLGIITIVCTLLYSVPPTSILGAILLTGYLGGAIASHLRIGSPLFTHTLFGLYLGLMVWGGLYLRDGNLRALLPFRR